MAAPKKTLTDLSKANQHSISQIWRKLEPSQPGVPHDLEWVATRVDELTSNLPDWYPNPGTRKNKYAAMSVVFRENGHDKLREAMQPLMSSCMDNVVSDQEDQVLSEREKPNWVPLHAVVAKREELREAVKANPYDHKAWTNYLLLCLYTMQPPVRLNYHSVLIITEEPAPSTEENYLLRQGDKFTFLINVDKTATPYGPGRHVFSDELSAIIKRSLECIPRTYLICKQADRTQGVESQSVKKYLAALHPNPAKRLGVDVLRSSYITDFYSKHHDLKSRKELAALMRHTHREAERAYSKFKGDAELQAIYAAWDRDSEGDAACGVVISDSETETESEQSALPKPDAVIRAEKRAEKAAAAPEPPATAPANQQSSSASSGSEAETDGEGGSSMTKEERRAAKKKARTAAYAPVAKEKFAAWYAEHGEERNCQLLLLKLRAGVQTSVKTATIAKYQLAMKNPADNATWFSQKFPKL